MGGSAVTGDGPEYNGRAPVGHGDLNQARRAAASSTPVALEGDSEADRDALNA